MAATNETSISRKRHATYGKTVRKRPPEHVATRGSFSTHSIFDSDHVLEAERTNSTDTSQHDDKLRNATSPPFPTSPNLDALSHPEPTSSSYKKRKLLRPTRTSGPNNGIKPLSHEALPGPASKSNMSFMLAGRQRIDSQSRSDEGQLEMAQANTTVPPKASKTERTGFSQAVPKSSPSKEFAKPRLQRSEFDVGILAQAPRHKRAKMPSTEMFRSGPRENNFEMGTKSNTSPKPHPSKVAQTPPHMLVPTVQNPIVESPAKILTPKGMKMWNGLLGDNAKSTLKDQTKLVIQDRGRSPIADTRPPRRRLIDSLVEQSDGPIASSVLLSDSEEDEEAIPKPAKFGEVPHTTLQRSESHGTLLPHLHPVNQKGSSNTATEASQTAQNSNARITYSRQRSILAEKDLSEELAISMPLRHNEVSEKSQRRGSVAPLKPLNSFRGLDDIDEAHTGGSIRTVHELRQAGANNRFTDEVEDLLDRIGYPGHQLSMRRSALLELAEKMNERYFLEKFIANGMDQRLFLYLGQETDVISGYLMVSMLLIVLNNGVTSAVVAQIHRQDVARLLLRLVDVEETLAALSKNRKSNISKIAQTMLAEFQLVLLRLGIWDNMKPSVVSPRTLALRVLELIIRQTPGAKISTDSITKDLATKLFDVVHITSCDSAFWNIPCESHNVDFYYAISTLESLSSKAAVVSKESSWAESYLPIIRDVLQRTLTRTPCDSGLLQAQALALRMTLNVTNNNPEATEIFATPQLIMAMSNTTIARFRSLYGFMVENERLAAVDHLVLMLGVMINLAEWSLAARHCFETLQNNDVDPLEALIQVFSDNLDRAFEAESFEDSHRNVAFGYLSVLLGYLCLNPDIHLRVNGRLGKESLQPLIGSIEEFISHHKKVDDLLKTDTNVQHREVGLTERLQGMVHELRGTRK